MPVTSVGLALPAGEFVVSGTPVVSVGTLAGDWRLQPKNLFLAGPVSGADATPHFRAITPADLVPVVPPAPATGYLVWLKRGGTFWQDYAKTIPAVAQNDPVYVWEDSSGHGYDAVRDAVIGGAPLLDVNWQNGFPATHFTNPSRFNVIPTGSHPQPFTMVLAFRYNTLGSSFNNMIQAFAGSSAYIEEFPAGTLNIADGANASAGPIDTLFHTMVVEWHGSSTKVHIDSAAPITINPGTGGFLDTIRLGSGGDGQAFCDIGEFLAYDGLLSPTDLALTLSYMNGWTGGFPASVQSVSPGHGTNITGTPTNPIVNINTPIALADIPALPASQVTSGTFALGLIPALPASQVTSGTFALARIPALPASMVTSGTFAVGLIPGLPGSIITSGTIGSAYLPAGTAANAATTLVKTTTSIVFVAGFTITDSAGLHGMLILKNTGVNQAQIQVVTTDAFGNVQTGAASNIFATGTQFVSLDIGGLQGVPFNVFATPPFVSVVINFRDPSGGGLTIQLEGRSSLVGTGSMV